MARCDDEQQVFGAGHADSARAPGSVENTQSEMGIFGERIQDKIDLSKHRRGCVGIWSTS